MRRATLSRWFVLALFAVLLFSVPALAAEHGGEHGGEGGGILDKMKFTGIHRWDLGLYTLIVFALLMFILSRYAWPHIQTGLEKREANILSALEQAKRDRTEAAALLAQAKKDLDETAAKVAGMLADARKDADALKAARAEEGEREAAAARERAKRETEEQRAALIKEVQQQAVELAVLIASKALRQQVSIANQGALLDESIAELKTNATLA